MRVHVTAYGDLCRYLPEAERESGAQVDLRDGATPIQLLDALRLPYHATWLIGVNDTVVGLDHALSEGDQIELMLPVSEGSGDYLTLREQLFAGETVNTLYEKIQNDTEEHHA
ncbi:MAG: MoaD/ThiS family protein [Chloroflexi bacterium]|nr:MoaD/ThiS family protein [Chloroflexota bacterium]